MVSGVWGFTVEWSVRLGIVKDIIESFTLKNKFINNLILSLILVLSVLSIGIAADPYHDISCHVISEEFEPIGMEKEQPISNQKGAISLYGASVEDGRNGKAIRLTNSGWAQYFLPVKLNTREGSISFWIKPLWSEVDKRSQTFLSMSWVDGRDGYLALSQGWWEPDGSQRLYFILNNQDYIHCSLPYKLVPGFWTHFTVTWKNGNNGGCRIYIDGKKAAETNKSYFTSYTSAGSIVLGSDRGSAENKGRGAEVLIDDLMFFSCSLSDEEVKARFQIQLKDSDLLEHKEGKWLAEGLKLPLKKERTKDGTLIETRVIFDEDISWATSRMETDRILSRIKRAGFNVYVPCVWHGGGAYYSSMIASSEPKLKRRIDSGDDPLFYLVEKAHAMGIQIHPWFTVVYRETDKYTKFFDDGTPKSAFNVHNSNFRQFIEELMLDVVRRYNIDGVNLDYIRTLGVCTSSSCSEDYEKRSGYGFWPDYALRSVSGQAHDRLQKWQDDAVAQIVLSLSNKTRQLKPGVIISVAGYPLPKGTERPLEGRDEVFWANKDWIDVIYAMDYREKIDFETLDRVRGDLNVPDKLTVLFGNYEMRGKEAIARSGKVVSNFAEYARHKWPKSGVAFYLYGRLSDDQIESLGSGVFSEKALPSYK